MHKRIRYLSYQRVAHAQASQTCTSIRTVARINKCSRDRYLTHFFCLAVEAGFYSDVGDRLPLDPAAYGVR